MADRVEILLVEDTPSDVRLTQEALKDSQLNHNLTVVNDGDQALEFLKKVAGSPQQPGLILLDLNMPKKNGHEVLDELKDMKTYIDVPVILLTVSRDEEDILKALRVKMNYYLGKPVTAEKLNTLLKAINDLRTEGPSKANLQGEDAHVRYVMAGNPHTSPAVLTALAAENNAHIRMRVAENPRTPVDLLHKLAADSEPDVRLGVAENQNAPESLLEKLASDANDDVRLGIASNPKIPVPILRRLSEDEHPHVAGTAAATLSKLGQAAR
jgi:two-component system, chemotaxis family, response regulator Rcp1